MDDNRTVWCGNLSDQVTEELLYELFLQVAPLERVRIPTDKGGKKMNYGFITFKHEMSIDYALQLLNGTRMFEKNLNIKRRNKTSNDMNNSRNEMNNSPNEPRNMHQLHHVSDILGPNSPNRQRPWNDRHSEHDDRFRDRRSPYDRREYHNHNNRRDYNYDQRNESPQRRHNDLRRNLSNRRNRPWH